MFDEEDVGRSNGLVDEIERVDKVEAFDNLAEDHQIVGDLDCVSC